MAIDRINPVNPDIDRMLRYFERIGYNSIEKKTKKVRELSELST